jgi:cell division protein FtsB
MKQWISVVAILAIAVAHAVVDNEAGLGMWLDLRDEAFAARERVAVLEHDVERLTTEIAALGTDPLAIERAIREDLELARPGEWVVRFGAATGDRTGL